MAAATIAIAPGAEGSRPPRPPPLSGPDSTAGQSPLATGCEPFTPPGTSRPHRPGRPRGHPPRRDPGRPLPRPGPTGHQSTRDRRRHTPLPGRRQVNWQAGNSPVLLTEELGPVANASGGCRDEGGAVRGGPLPSRTHVGRRLGGGRHAIGAACAGQAPRRDSFRRSHTAIALLPLPKPQRGREPAVHPATHVRPAQGFVAGVTKE
jgi:hypothetical protein